MRQCQQPAMLPRSDERSTRQNLSRFIMPITVFCARIRHTLASFQAALFGVENVEALVFFFGERIVVALDFESSL